MKSQSDYYKVNFRLIAFLIFISSPLINAQLEVILNSISSDSLMTTMKELTGAAPVVIDGKIDTIKTRAHLTTYNRQAMKYIENKLQQYGLQTEKRHYFTWTSRNYVESYTDIKFNNNSWWFCTDWGEIFSSSDFPVIESRNLNGIPFKHRLDWINFSGNDTIISMGKTGYFLLSADGGNTWRKDSTGLKPLVDFIRTDNILIAAGYEGKIWRSSDYGSSWTPVFINNNFKINDCEVFSDNKVIAVGRDSLSNYGAVYISSDKGINWQTIPGTYTSPIVSASVYNEKCWFADKDGKIFYNVSPGNWSLINTPDTAITAKKIFFTSYTHGWLLSKYNYLYKTTDKGYSWTYTAFIDTPDVIENFVFTDSLNGIVTGKQRYAVITTDAGENWNDNTIPLTNVVVGFVPGSTEPEKAIILAAHTDCIINLKPSMELSGFEISHGADDDGSGTVALLELARVFKQYPAEYTLAFTFIPTEELGHGGCGDARDIVLEKVDSIVFGLDLDMIAYDSLNNNLLSIGYNNTQVSERVYSNLNTFFNAAGIQISSKPNQGVSTINVCLPNNYPAFFITEYPVNGLYIQPNYHDITDTWNSLNYDYFTSVTKAVALMAYHISTGELLSANDNANKVNDYFLSDAYPNPFNSQTVINFSLPARDFVTLKIYDLLGNEIKTLVNEIKSAGEHSVEFNASHLSSGMYICRMKAGGYTSSKKMIYMK